jgi:hypothetical protein
MHKGVRSLCFAMLALFAYFTVYDATSCDRESSSNPAVVSSLRSFLQSYLRVPPGNEDKTTRYSFAVVDLNSDGNPEVIVYLTGNNWCGSGGCTTLVLSSDNSTFRVITRITVSRPPLRMFTAKTNGWHEIGVWVQGGGAATGYEAELSFDGRTYPNNPTVSPARRLAGNTPAQVLLPNKVKGTLLYD